MTADARPLQAGSVIFFAVAALLRVDLSTQLFDCHCLAIDRLSRQFRHRLQANHRHGSRCRPCSVTELP